MSETLTARELQALRNTGNEAERAADEIEQLRADLATVTRERNEALDHADAEASICDLVAHERDALRAENERLRGALSDVMLHCISLADAQVIAMQALQEPTP